MAYDYWRREQIARYLEPFREKTRKKEGVDFPSFYALLLALME